MDVLGQIVREHIGKLDMEYLKVRLKRDEMTKVLNLVRDADRLISKNVELQRKLERSEAETIAERNKNDAINDEGNEIKFLCSHLRQNLDVLMNDVARV